MGGHTHAGTGSNRCGGSYCHEAETDWEHLTKLGGGGGGATRRLTEEKWRARVRVPACSDLGQRSVGRHRLGDVTVFLVEFRGLVPAVHPSVRLSGVIPRAKEDRVPGGVSVRRSLGLPGWGWGGGPPASRRLGDGERRVPRPATLAAHGEMGRWLGFRAWAPRPTSPTPPHPVVATTWTCWELLVGPARPGGGGQKPDVSEGS